MYGGNHIYLAHTGVMGHTQEVIVMNKAASIENARHPYDQVAGGYYPSPWSGEDGGPQRPQAGTGTRLGSRQPRLKGRTGVTDPTWIQVTL